MEKRICLATRIPNPKDATSFYRAIGPLSELRRQMPELDLQINPQSYEWQQTYFWDVFFMQRPGSPADLQVAKQMKRDGIKLWVDYDDDLFSVPLSNPSYPIYANPEVRKSVEEILGLADLVTTSTSALGHKLNKFTNEIAVVPNAFPDHKVQPRIEHKTQRRLVNWRGSITHQKDLATFAPQIIQLANEFPDWKWSFMGHSYWALLEKMPKDSVILYDAMDVTTYWEIIRTLMPAIQMIPLEDNEFNRSKSNIAWIEGTYAGASCVSPDWGGWPGHGSRYSNPNQFYEVMKVLMKGETMWDDWPVVRKSYFLSDVNQIRANLLRKLVDN